LLKQQSSITVYRSPTKKNKCPFSAFVYSTQTEVYRFRFPFAGNKQKLPFSISSVFCLRSSGNVETSNGKREARQFSLIRLTFAPHANGSLSIVRLLMKKETEVDRLQTDQRTCSSMYFGT
jgi:hypothetical protein